MVASISRLIDYRRRHGFGGTVKRAAVAAKRAFFARHMVVFWCDLAGEDIPAARLSDSLRVERLRKSGELSTADFQKITVFWNPGQARRNIEQRLELGACLWLIKCEHKLAGYGWTLRARTIEPYYFPLAPDDAHLFDFHVFPEYRGRGINPSLVGEILKCLAGELRGRAFIEAAEWNEAQLASLRKTPFRYLGRVSTLNLFGHRFVNWAGRPSSQATHENVGQADGALRPGPSGIPGPLGR